MEQQVQLQKKKCLLSFSFSSYLCHGRPPRRGGPDAERRDEHEPPELRAVVAAVAEARVHEPLRHAVVQVRLRLHMHAPRHQCQCPWPNTWPPQARRRARVVRCATRRRRWRMNVLRTYPGEEALVGAVHRLPPGDELEEEDAEGEHVRLLVHDAVREVLRRQAPAHQCRRLSVVSSPCFYCHGHGPWRTYVCSPEGALDGRDGVVRPLRRQPPGEAEVRNLRRIQFFLGEQPDEQIASRGEVEEEEEPGARSRRWGGRWTPWCRGVWSGARNPCGGTGAPSRCRRRSRGAAATASPAASRRGGWRRRSRGRRTRRWGGVPGRRSSRAAPWRWGAGHAPPCRAPSRSPSPSSRPPPPPATAASPRRRSRPPARRGTPRRTRLSPPYCLSWRHVLNAKSPKKPTRIYIYCTSVEAIGGLVDLLIREAPPSRLVRRRRLVDDEDALVIGLIGIVAPATERQEPLEAPAPEIVHPPHPPNPRTPTRQEHTHGRSRDGLRAHWMPQGHWRDLALFSKAPALKSNCCCCLSRRARAAHTHSRSRRGHDAMRCHEREGRGGEGKTMSLSVPVLLREEPRREQRDANCEPGEASTPTVLYTRVLPARDSWVPAANGSKRQCFVRAS